jgi:beta-galactosidase GanA
MIAIGAQYYRPPNPPASDWADDLRRMRDNGFDTVKFWACWSWLQLAPDRIDFGDLDRLMDLAADCQLRVVLNTILENAPYWLEQAHPEARYRDADGRQIQLTAAMNTPGGGWPGLCFDNAPVLDAARRFLTRLAERYRDHPALRMWDVWNEPHLEPASYFPDRMYCYCPGSLAGFQRWLMNRYDSLQSLNETWARRYTDWAQVAPPRQFEAVPDLLDWRAYWFANLSRWLTLRAAAMRAADPAHEVMTHVALSGFTGQLATHTLDEFTLTEPVDVFGTSSFPAWLMGDDPVEHFFNLDAARDAAAGKPFWQAELQGGRGRRDGPRSTPHPSPDMLHLWMWNAYASGASGVMFWQWRPELLGPEAPGYGLCTPDGSPTSRSAAAARFADVMNADHLTRWQPDPPSFALLVSRRTALLAYATDRTMDLYAEAVLGAYRMLTDADVTVTVLHEDQVEADGVPGHLTRLYWPMPAVSSDQLAASLDAFVRRGGRLLAEAGPGEYTPYGWRRPRLPFADLFGIKLGEADACTAVPVSLRDGGTLTGTWQRDSITAISAEVLGSFPDGTPAVTANRLERGTAIQLGTVPSLAYYRTRDHASRLAISHLLGAEPRCRTARYTQPQPGLVTRPGQLADGRRGVIALNWSASPQEIAIGETSITVSSSHTGAARRTARAGDLIRLPSHAALLVLTERPVTT